jgi:alkylhydroperoxidase family enzyme
MTRFPHLEPRPEAAARISAAGARPLNLYRILANNPTMLDAWLSFAYVLRADCVVPRDLRELMILRTAQQHHSAYEWDQHLRMALAAGVSMVKVNALNTWRGAMSEFSSRERAALNLTDAMCANKMTQAVHDLARQHFSDAEMIELIMTAGFYCMVPRVLQAIDATTEGEEDAECDRAVRSFDRQIMNRQA